MSFYDDASIVLIPSGYKTSKLYSQKPTDGSGDLTFTRTGSTATRVNENGLIERCRTNLSLHSEDFTNAAWVKDGATVSGNTVVAPNGTQTMDSITFGTSGNNIYQQFAVSSGVPYTFSVWLSVPSGTQTVEIGNINVNVYTTVTVTTTPTRFTVTQTSSGTTRFPTIRATGAYTIYAWGAQFELGDIATAYIPTTTAAVTVGPIANLPRLDYTGGGCPKLLMEPTRTNLITYSEAFNNAAWTKLDATVVQNVAISPDGYQNADRIVVTSVGGGDCRQTISYTSGTTYAFSVFVKKESTFNLVGITVVTQAAIQFNIDTNAFSTIALLNGWTLSSTKYDDYGNGWKRISVVLVAGTTGSYGTRLAEVRNTGNGTSGILFYGAQLEAGSYATSYIPTFNASVTRNQDICVKGSISSLIGQTEGTIYAEFNLSNYNTVKALSTIDVGSTTNFISVAVNSGIPRLVVREAGVSSNLMILTQLPLGNYKLAIGYKAGDYVMYINGQQVGASTSTVYPVGTLTQYILNNASYGELADGYNQAILFKTRLSNSDLATLTTL